MKLLTHSPADTRLGKARINLLNSYRSAVGAGERKFAARLKRLIKSQLALCCVCAKAMPPDHWHSATCSTRCGQRRVEARKLAAYRDQYT
jgi:hypothetical protein